MAKATAYCMCATCGREFERTAYKRNAREAVSWAKWAEKNMDECSDCYKVRMQEVNRAKASRFDLPMLTAVSDKQREFAESLRSRFVAENEEMVSKVQEMIEYSATQEYKEECVAQDVDPDEYLQEILSRSSFRRKAYVCLTDADARELIDALKY